MQRSFLIVYMSFFCVLSNSISLFLNIFYSRIVSYLVLNEKKYEIWERPLYTMANDRLTVITGWSFWIATQYRFPEKGKRFDLIED